MRLGHAPCAKPNVTPHRRASAPDRALDPIEAAAVAGLRYVSDDAPGIRRRRAGAGFAYTAPDGNPLRDPTTTRRIKSLVIPPAWTDVWICPIAHGHIQATGRDARHRKQYIYHQDWRAVRDAAKFASLVAFGESLPRIRDRVAHDMQLPGMPRDKILATLVRLLDETSIRVGNDEYRRQNNSFGLTTLRERHVTLDGSNVRFEFRGKGRKQLSLELHDRRVARVLKECEELPGQELFQYVDETGQRHTIASDDVNGYLREISGGDFTAKHFRTWNATVLAMHYLQECEPCSSARESRRTVTEAIKSVASHLGNTPATCRKAYVHPAVVQSFESGNLATFSGSTRRPEGPALSNEEQCVLKLLRSS